MPISISGKKGLSKKEEKRFRRWVRDGYGTNPLCYLCQQNLATTDDHVPPKALLSTTCGANAHFLPSCRPCNSLLRDDEEYLRNVLASSGYTPDARRARQDAARSFRDDSSLYPFDHGAEFLRNLTPRDIFSAGGIWRGRALTFDASAVRIDPVVVKIVRGLHYHETKSPLPSDAVYKVSGFSALESQPVADLLIDFKRFPRYAGAQFPNVLTYLAWEVQGLESAVWVLQFYRSMSFVVFANSPALIAELEAYDNRLIIRPRLRQSGGVGGDVS